MQRTLLLFMLISLAYTVQSQDQKVKLGLHAGPNLVGFYRAPGINDYRKHRPDFSLGLSIEIPLGTKFTLKSGLEYEGKGQRIAFPATDVNAMHIGTAKINVSLDYLQVPLLASYKISKGKTHIYLDFGPYAGYLLAAKTIDQPIGQYEGAELKHTEEYKSIELGIMGGLGVAFPLSDKIEGSIAVHDHLGITNIATPQIANFPIKTHTIGLRLGAMFRI